MSAEIRRTSENTKNYHEQTEEMEAIRVISEDLRNLEVEVSSNIVENLSLLSLEELYDKSEELNNENTAISDSKFKTSNNITGLKAYLNMNLDEKEESDTHEKIGKYQKELEDLNNKLNQNVEILKSIESEMETRSSEINSLFNNLFDSIQFGDDGFSDEITSTVVEENGKEIGKEINIVKLFGNQCLFRSNDGNFYITLPGNKGRESANIKTVYSFLRGIYDKIKPKKDSQKIDDTIESNKSNQEADELDIINNLIENVEYLGIDEKTVHEYINIIKNSGNISESLDDDLKNNLGFDSIEGDISLKEGCVLFYVKKSCPNRYREILPIVQRILGSHDTIKGQYGILKRTIGSIKRFGDSAYEYLKFCSPFEGSYMREGISHMQNRNFGETFDQMIQRKFGNSSTISNLNEKINNFQDDLSKDSILVQYFENFEQEPESLNLFSFIKEYPQKLDNLGGKEIKSINLSIDSGINFAFRGILEMVKSRHDISFPNFSESFSESGKTEWKNQREKIIKEYENMLRNYIARDIQENIDGNKNTFDKIFFSGSKGDTGFGTKDSDFMPSKERVQQFSGNEVLDYSDEEERFEKGQSEEIKLILDIEKYVIEHPNEKILVCINQHGGIDGSSGNGRIKENWQKLANISPNVKIRSIRCYFGTAFSDIDIYGQLSAISGFSNNTVTSGQVGEIITDASKKNLGFHEMEIYTRLNYPITVTPLTESMEYTNRDTGETEIGKIGLAQNNEGQGDNYDNNYA